MSRIRLAASLAACSLLAACDPSTPASAPGGVADPSAKAPLSLFAPTEALPTGATKVVCAIDRVNGQLAAGATVTVTQRGAIRIVGWTSDAQRSVPAAFRVLLVGNDTHGVGATAGLARADVARSLRAEGLANAGFDVTAALGDVPPGEYAVALAAEGAAGPEVCPTRTRIVVAAP